MSQPRELMSFFASKLWVGCARGSAVSRPALGPAASPTRLAAAAAAARACSSSARRPGHESIVMESGSASPSRTPCYRATARGLRLGALAVASRTAGRAAAAAVSTRQVGGTGSSTAQAMRRRYYSGGGGGKAGGNGSGGPGNAGDSAGSAGGIEIGGLEELEDVMQFGYTEDTKHYTQEFQEYIRGGTVSVF